jgi:CheY-like chemotaxis protein
MAQIGLTSVALSTTPLTNVRRVLIFMSPANSATATRESKLSHLTIQDLADAAFNAPMAYVAGNVTGYAHSAPTLHPLELSRRSKNGLMRAERSIVQKLRNASLAAVLVISNDATCRRVLRRVLRSLNLTALTAVDGRRGVDLFRRARPDVVFTELLMPDRDGIETLLAIRREMPAAKVIVMSAPHPRFDGLLDQCMLLGACAVLRKPFSFAELVAAIYQCVG